MIYLDHAATTPVDPEVLEAMLPFFTSRFANPASAHRQGREAARTVERARLEIAGFLGTEPDEIVFTSGGTESNNHALGGAAGEDRAHVVTSGIEHPSVLEMCRHLQRLGRRVSIVPVDRRGLVDPGDVRRAVTDRTAVISIMHASNEVGTVQPLGEIGEIARERGILLHTDAVQTLGHLPVNVRELGVHLLSASAHKLYGPKGVGILYVRRGVSLPPLLRGGLQEGGRRASTLNVPGIVGMGRAVALARERMGLDAGRVAGLRDRLVRSVLERIEGAGLSGHPSQRLPNNASFTFEGVDGREALLRLDLEGIACSVGSACSFEDREPSHVLRAMGLDAQEARGALRFSLGRSTTGEEIDRVVDVLVEVIRDLRRGGARHAAGHRRSEPSPEPAREQAARERTGTGPVGAGRGPSPSPSPDRARGPQPSGACRITRIRGGGRETVDDLVVTEAPLTILLNRRELATIICTPEDLQELAAGYLFSERIIASREDIRSMELRPDLGAVQVETHARNEPYPPEPGRSPASSGQGTASLCDDHAAPGIRLSRFITPGCFSYTVAGEGAERIDSPLTVPARLLLDLVREMERRSRLYRSTGGVHSAALCKRQSILYFNEDVGRHNAVDKLLGKCLLDGVSPRAMILVMSGRVSSAMMVKVVNARIPLAASRSAPTTESVRVADRLGITLAGFVRGNRMNVYSHPWRLL